MARGQAPPESSSRLELSCGALCRQSIQDVANILGSLYLSMLFLGIINSRTIQPVAANERAVSHPCLSPALLFSLVLL